MSLRIDSILTSIAEELHMTEDEARKFAEIGCQISFKKSFNSVSKVFFESLSEADFNLFVSSAILLGVGKIAGELELSKK